MDAFGPLPSVTHGGQTGPAGPAPHAGNSQPVGRRAPPPHSNQLQCAQMQSAFSAAAFCPRGRGRLAAKVARLAREVATPWARPGQTSLPRARGRALSPPPASHPPPRPGKGMGRGGGGHQNPGLDAELIKSVELPRRTAKMHILNTASTFYDVYSVSASKFNYSLHSARKMKVVRAFKAKV